MTTTLTSTVQAVDAANRVIAIDPNGAYDSVELNDATTVQFADGRTAVLADIQPGALIEVTGTGAGGPTILAERIVIQSSPEPSGGDGPDMSSSLTSVVQTVDTATRVIVIALTGAYDSVEVYDDTTISFSDGRSASLTDIQPGAQIEVTGIGAGGPAMRATQIVIRTSPDPSGGGIDMTTTVTSVVRTVDATNGVITFEPSGAYDSAEVTDATTLSFSDGRVATLADVQPGSQIEVTGLGAGGPTIVAEQIVILSSPDPSGGGVDMTTTVTSVVRTVDATNRVITFEPSGAYDSAEVTDATTLSFADGRVAVLTDVQLGNRIEVTGLGAGGPTMVAEQIIILGP